MVEVDIIINQNSNSTAVELVTFTIPSFAQAALRRFAEINQNACQLQWSPYIFALK